MIIKIKKLIFLKKHYLEYNFKTDESIRGVSLQNSLHVIFKGRFHSDLQSLMDRNHLHFIC